jgi:GAF domain-containing protein
LRCAATTGITLLHTRPEFVEYMLANPLPLDPEKSITAKAAAERRAIEILDITDEQTHGAGQPLRRFGVKVEGIRTQLTVPMLRGDEAIGVIVVYRREVRGFEASHVELLTTFAEQAAIAVDNVRRFRALGEALERQTATSEILRVISRSPTDYGPVFDAILDSATRLCDAPLAFLLMREGDHIHLVAHRGSRPEFVEWMKANPVPPSEQKTLGARAAAEGVPQQLADITDTEGYREGLPHRVVAADIEGVRTTLFVPMMKDDGCVGEIAVYRREVRPFDESQIALLSTFADQAVIAIDNVRLFQALDERTRELARSVEELRALGEIGQAVNSTLDPETVLTTIIKHAVALTGTDGGLISEYDEATGTLPARAAP